MHPECIELDELSSSTLGYSSASDSHTMQAPQAGHLQPHAQQLVLPSIATPCLPHPMQPCVLHYSTGQLWQQWGQQPQQPLLSPTTDNDMYEMLLQMDLDATLLQLGAELQQACGNDHWSASGLPDTCI